MDNLKEKFEQVIQNDKWKLFDGEYDDTASACVSVVIDMLEGISQKLYDKGFLDSQYLVDTEIDKLKSLIQ